MRKMFNLVLSIIVFTGVNCYSAAKIRVAASLPDIASIASYIGGDKVETFSIAKGNVNSHFVEVLPSYMIKVSRAKLYLKVGLSLDQWADGIIEGARNSKLTVIDCSNDVAVLEKPVKADAILGDVHPQGNPHYWLDPSNGIIIAENILNGLTKVDPDDSGYYQSNFESFKKETETRLKAWREKMFPLNGQKIIGYHSSWIYFAHAFGLKVAGYVEPFPGIPPTGKHLSEVITVIKAGNIKILIQEPYFPDASPEFLSRETGIKVFKLAPSCLGTGKYDYLNNFDSVISQLTK